MESKPSSIDAREQPGAGTSIMLIDDDAELCELLQEFLAARGLRLEIANDGRRGLSRA